MHKNVQSVKSQIIPYTDKDVTKRNFYLLWKMSWQYLIRLNTHVLYNSAFLGIYYCKMVVHIQKIGSEMFTAVVFVIFKTMERMANFINSKMDK